MQLNRIGDTMSQHHGMFFTDDFVQGDEMIDLDEGAGAIVDEDVSNIGGERVQSIGDGILPFGPAGNKRWSRSEGGEFAHLFLIAIHDHE